MRRISNMRRERETIKVALRIKISFPRVREISLGGPAGSFPPDIFSPFFFRLFFPIFFNSPDYPANFAFFPKNLIIGREIMMIKIPIICAVLRWVPQT